MSRPVTGPDGDNPITDAQCRESGASPDDIERATQATDRHWTRFQRNMRKSARSRCAAAWNAAWNAPHAAPRIADESRAGVLDDVNALRDAKGREPRGDR